MNKLEKLIESGFNVKIQSSSKFCLTLEDSIPYMRFNSDSIEDAIDSAYNFLAEQKKIADKTVAVTEKEDCKIIVDIPQSKELVIDEDMLNDEFKTTNTIRLYTYVWEQFKSFTDTYKEYKSMDLVSMALLEYIEKYKK